MGVFRFGITKFFLYQFSKPNSLGDGNEAKGRRVSTMEGLGMKEELTKGGYGDGGDGEGNILMLGIYTGPQQLLFLLLASKLSF
ncbi:hypothetical protein VNO78_24005 [Psophocarpus tetragonolobus]|uniref:Uncharacterized protein n=1 Tax=Psophocarpus tetragonolobus TaxID=3891 RepID=A0AAN9S470_PSOTE